MTSWSVVTGGGGGMGLACARRLGQEGPVLLADIDRERLRAALDDLQREGIDAVGVACDVSDPASVASLAGALRERGLLRALAHTAGLSPMMAPAERIYAVNLAGTALVTEAFLPLAAEGSVCVCIASMAGQAGEQRASPEVDAILDAPLPGKLLEQLQALGPELHADHPGVAYELSKWGVQRWVRHSATAWGKRGARIVSVSPGIIDTPMADFEAERQPAMKEIAGRTPLGRSGRAEEIASVVAFLCSGEASYVTGVDLLVDGGAFHTFRASRLAE